MDQFALFADILTVLFFFSLHCISPHIAGLMFRLAVILSWRRASCCHQVICFFLYILLSLLKPPVSCVRWPLVLSQVVILLEISSC